MRLLEKTPVIKEIKEHLFELSHIKTVDGPADNFKINIYPTGVGFERHQDRENGKFLIHLRCNIYLVPLVDFLTLVPIE